MGNKKKENKPSSQESSRSNYLYTAGQNRILLNHAMNEFNKKEEGPKQIRLSQKTLDNIICKMKKIKMKENEKK